MNTSIQSAKVRFYGFTLIELVVTILLLAILSVVVLPRFIGAGSFSAYALRQEFISELRRAQMLAINNPDRCYQLEVDSSGYQLHHLQSDCASLIFSDAKQSLPRNTQIQLLTTASANFTLQFDSDGRSTFNAGAVSCSGSCLQIIADDTVGIAIESEGYIHED